MVAALVGGLSLTSCKKETTETTETETTVIDGDTATVIETELPEEIGTKDTIQVTKDTITVKKP